MEVSLQKNKELTYLYVYIILIKVPGQTNRTKKNKLIYTLTEFTIVI